MVILLAISSPIWFGKLGTPSVMTITVFGADGRSPFRAVNISVLMYLQRTFWYNHKDSPPQTYVLCPLIQGQAVVVVHCKRLVDSAGEAQTKQKHKEKNQISGLS